jgi:pyruvate/2-oxoglutarate/acetoin dehydrogenase E1 component
LGPSWHSRFMKYLDAIQKGMDYWASVPNTIFVGQAMLYKGHAISRQVQNYSHSQKLETPVFENTQTGMCLGLALEGYIPICCFPRNDFAILACDSIINHIDKWPLMCPNSNPKIILKLVVGSDSPLDPKWQHKANHFEAFESMCHTITCFNLTRTSHFANEREYKRQEFYDYIDYAYKSAIEKPGSFIIVEDAQLYQDA